VISSLAFLPRKATDTMVNGLMMLHCPLIIEDARPQIVDALLTLIFRRW